MRLNFLPIAQRWVYRLVAQQHSGRRGVKPRLPFKAKVSKRNSISEFERDVIEDVRLNRFAAESRISTLLARRSVKGDAQTAWLAKAVTCIDLTTLAGDDTPGKVRRMCGKAAQPVSPELLTKLGLPELRCGAVCVYHRQVSQAVRALEGTDIPVAAVSTGFPAGQTPHALKLREIRASVKAGAREIDIVITREHVLTGAWRKLYDEVRDFREAAGAAHVKAILATGDLRTLRNIAKASLVAMQAGADFIKTSTGKESVNANFLVTLVMLRAIREHSERTGYRVGFKPAGGVSTAKAAIQYQIMMAEELGREWLEPELFRIGASSLLGDIERQLEHRLTGLYSAANRHAIG